MSFFNRGNGQVAGAATGRGKYNLEYLKGGLAEGITSAVMMVDRNFVVTYVNQATKDLLTAHADEFRKLWPNFRPEAIVGSCIDMFHKNPSHQRQLLSDPSRLPYKTEITIGTLKVMLLVSGSFDKNGEYVGNVLEWKDVTQERLNEGLIAALNKA
ncbi:MAG: hypothetical protein ACOY5F_10785 [Pseudomonadota bacterium]